MTRRLAVQLLLLASACGSIGRGGDVPAAAGVEQYVRAVRADDARAVWGMLTPEVRRGTTWPEFEKQWRATAGERRRQADRLEAGLRSRVVVDEHALVGYPDGTSVSLRREEGRWRIDVAFVSGVVARSPRDAVRAFASALHARSYPQILRTLSTDRRDAITQRLDAVVQGLVLHTDDEPQENGDHATLTWELDGVVYRIRLVREGDDWRIDDIDWREPPDDD